MPYRITPFKSTHYYHIFNRGVEKREIFSSERDYQRFLETLYYYQFGGPKPQFSTQERFRINEFTNNPRLIEIVTYCLMPNHFHILLKQVEEGGIQEFASKVLNSYTKFYNTKHDRIGPLFQGVFKAVLVETDDQLLHLSRYIHLNPYVAGIVKKVEDFPYSSYHEFIHPTATALSIPEAVLAFFKNPQDYQQFVHDHKEYARELAMIKHLVLDEH